MTKSATVTLAKDEKPVYEYICRKYNIDPQHQSRRLELTPDHYVELAVANANLGADEIMAVKQGNGTDGRLETIDQMMGKFAEALKRENLAGEAQKKMRENYPQFG